MDAQETDLIRQIKCVGVTRSLEILHLLSAWEGETVDGPKPALSKKRTNNLVLLGDMTREAMPKGQRGRRKGDVDPNSARQRVFRAMREYLKHGPRSCAEVLLHVENVTGLDPAKCKANAFQCPDIKRQYGTWSLTAALKAA